MKIPFFNYQYLNEAHGNDFMKIIKDVMSRGAYILQKDLVDFEESFSEYLGVKHAIGVANCTDGLFLGLKAAGIKQGDEVIISSHTFIATASAVYDLGAKAVPVDCGVDHMIDPEKIELAITNKTKAIMPTQLNGRTCDMDKIFEIANRHGLNVLEDAAQGLGSTYKGVKAGAFGIAAAFSFYPAKILPCIGDGGMVTTSDDSVAEKVRQFRDHGRNNQGQVVRWGMNSRLDNMQAAILNFMLNDYESVIIHRRELADTYNKRLSNINDLVLPPAPELAGNYFDVYQNYEVESTCRDDLKKYLAERGVGSILQWGGTAVHQFKNLGFDQNLPFTDKVMSRSMLLPMNMSLNKDHINYICDVIEGFYEKLEGNSETAKSSLYKIKV